MLPADLMCARTLCRLLLLLTACCVGFTQVQVLQQERAVDHPGHEQDHEAALDAAIRSEHEFLMQELVSAKLELAEVKEQQLITQRQLFKAQQQSGLTTSAH